MGIFNTAKNSTPFNWTNFDSDTQWEEMVSLSYQTPVLIFKHSTRCPVSSMAKKRMEREWDIENEKVQCYYLDLLNHRELSNLVASKTGVVHQSPQAILIRNGAVVYHSSHDAISALDIKKMIE